MEKASPKIYMEPLRSPNIQNENKDQSSSPPLSKTHYKNIGIKLHDSDTKTDNSLKDQNKEPK